MRLNQLLASLCIAATVGTLMAPVAHAQRKIPMQEALVSSAAIPVQFDFAYEATDPQVLAFDDGRSTRLQLPAGAVLPTVIGEKTSGDVLVALQRQGPYLVIPDVFYRIRLLWGNGYEVQIQYKGQSQHAQKDVRAGPAVAFSGAAPKAVFGSAERPMSEAAVRQVVATAQTALVPPPSERTRRPEPAQVDAVEWPERPATGFDFRVEDKTIGGAVARWADQTGYDLVWDLPAEMDPEINAAGRLKANTIKDAIAQLQRGLYRKGYPCNVVVYSNRVIKFSPVAASPSSERGQLAALQSTQQL